MAQGGFKEVSDKQTCTEYVFLGWLSGTTVRESSLVGVLVGNTQWSATTSMSLRTLPGSGVNNGAQETMEGSDKGACRTWWTCRKITVFTWEVKKKHNNNKMSHYVDRKHSLGTDYSIITVTYVKCTVCTLLRDCAYEGIVETTWYSCPGPVLASMIIRPLWCSMWYSRSCSRGWTRTGCKLVVVVSISSTSELVLLLQLMLSIRRSLERATSTNTLGKLWRFN